MTGASALFFFTSSPRGLAALCSLSFLRLVLLLLLFPMPAELVVKCEYRGVELLPTDCRWVSVEVLADDGRRDRSRRAKHSDILTGTPYMAIRLKDLCGHRVDFWSRRNWLYAFKTLSLPAGFFVRFAGPVAPPAVGFDSFFAVSLARSSARVAISEATCKAVK